jgi:hypothetical protein
MVKMTDPLAEFWSRANMEKQRQKGRGTINCRSLLEETNPVREEIDSLLRDRRPGEGKKP